MIYCNKLDRLIFVYLVKKLSTGALGKYNLEEKI